MHGMAGSAALILLTQQPISPLQDISYIALFGLGSMVVMAALSVVIIVPLRYFPRSISWLHHGLRGVVSLATIILGGVVIYTTGSSILS